MKVEPPKTKEDFQKIEDTLQELIGNKWVTHHLRIKLRKKLSSVRKQIKSFDNES